MRGIDLLAERAIRKAEADGVFDHLPGAGRPLPPDVLEGLAEAERAEALAIRSAGGAPEEVHLLREVAELRERIEALAEGPDKEALRARLRERSTVLAMAFERSGRMLSAREAAKNG